MLITVNPQDRRPIYEQVAECIRTLIAGGQLVEGQLLPPVRQLAADLGVNLNTIAAAYRELRDEGLITVRHGQRAAVTSRAPGKGAARKPKNDDLRRPLRNALTRMILAGLRPGDIMSFVNDELRSLSKGAKS